MLTSDEYVFGLSATAAAAVLNRPKREDCPRITNHDPAFSEWKTLVVPNDWKECSAGSERHYRSRNLPDCTTCCGVYELGIVAASHSGPVMPVYVGRADNVRTRLQQYGRDGDHLENSCKNVEFPFKQNGSCQKGCKLFTEALSKGYSIVYRWAPMKSKEDAERTESRLLKKYDYAWNKGSNGARRRDDVLNKPKPPAIIKHQKGFRIKAPEPDDPNTTCKGKPSVSRKVGLKKEHEYVGGPIIISDGYQQISGKACKEHTICGFGLSDGTFCTEKPPQGRRRCEEHKGLRIKETITEILPADNSACRKGHGKEAINNGSVTCCATLKDGIGCCSKKPAEGSTRCWQHGGKRSGSLNYYAPSSYGSSFYESSSSICGALTQKGYPCSRIVAAGGRCFQH